MTRDPLRALRARQNETGLALSRRGGAPLTSYPALVGCVFGNPTVPSTTATFFSVHPVDVAGPEAESNSGVLSVDTSRSFLVDVIGSKPPVAGDFLICRFVGNRWVAERMSRTASKVSIPGCPCVLVPTRLTMSVQNPAANGHMFQNATLQYGPTPAWSAPLSLGADAFLSTAWFTDGITGDQFLYYFSCFGGYYVLTRVYQTSLFGSPYRETTRYRWLVGLSGNTCLPFLLSNGQVFAGGDPSSAVTMSE